MLEQRSADIYSRSYNIDEKELTFKPLTMQDKEIFIKYLSQYKFATCEYSFANLVLWRKGCDIRYIVYKDSLIIKKKDFEGNYYFMQPLGYKKEDLKSIIDKLQDYKEKNNFQYLFKDIEEPFLNELKEIYKQEISVVEDIDNFDYIYTQDSLANLSGKKLHGKKNHYNYFIKNYSYEVKDISELTVKEDCLEALKIWLQEKDETDENLNYESEGIKEIINNMGDLNLKGMAVYVEGKLAAFTIGEGTNNDMAIIHVEKGLPDVKGIYSFINKTFVENYFSDSKYINREQDLGIEGLRKAKKSYNPVKLEKKYCVYI